MFVLIGLIIYLLGVIVSFDFAWFSYISMWDRIIILIVWIVLYIRYALSERIQF